MAALRAEADAVAGRYFAELDRLNALGRRIDDTEARVGTLTAEVARLRTRTRDRAVAAYLRAATGLPPVLGAGDAVTATRRVRWLRQLNAGDDAAAADLRAASARLAAERSDLRRTQALAAAALEEVRAEGRVVDTRLAEAEDRRRAAVAAATTTTTTGTSVGPGPTRPPGYVPTPGTHPRHDEAFLVCTRARESGGNYGAVNRAGPYLGAYQFLQSTWNVTAAHAGRPGLVGARPTPRRRTTRTTSTGRSTSGRGPDPGAGTATRSEPATGAPAVDQSSQAPIIARMNSSSEVARHPSSNPMLSGSQPTRSGASSSRIASAIIRAASSAGVTRPAVRSWRPSNIRRAMSA